MKTYTVVGYYEDNGQPWVEHAEAEDWCGAVVETVKSLEKTDPPSQPYSFDRSNITIVEVFEGAHMGLAEHESVCCAADFPGLEEEKEEEGDNG